MLPQEITEIVRSFNRSGISHADMQYLSNKLNRNVAEFRKMQRILRKQLRNHFSIEGTVGSRESFQNFKSAKTHLRKHIYSTFTANGPQEVVHFRKNNCQCNEAVKK